MTGRPGARAYISTRFVRSLYRYKTRQDQDQEPRADGARKKRASQFRLRIACLSNRVKSLGCGKLCGKPVQELWKTFGRWLICEIRPGD